VIFVGIDPGLHGALAWMDGERRVIEVRDCPLTSDGQYDYAKMADLLRRVNDASTSVTPPPPDITMEAVHALPSDGRCSAFSFGVGYGAWLAICGSQWNPPNLVSPRSWKRTMLAGIANDKQVEAKALKQRFQGHAVCSQLHGPRGGLRDGRVDALFLAEYGRVTWKLTGRKAA
jgi:crossover junction endodeoxyribonuclease RuvC